jgi:non-ribosomal peptide synthetase component F
LAGFATLLHSYTHQEDIVVGTLSPAGRKRTEVQALLGYFLNPVALRVHFGSHPTFRELLRQVRSVLSEAISHDDVPIEFLARELKPKADSSRSPFFTVALSLQPPMPDLDLEWSVTSMDVESGGASWDLYIAFIDRPNGMIGRAQYNPDLFGPPAITAMLGDLRSLLESVALNPEERLSDLRRLTPPKGQEEQ